MHHRVYFWIKTVAGSQYLSGSGKWVGRKKKQKLKAEVVVLPL